MKRHDEEYFAGLREKVLKRDEHACRVCGTMIHILVHHRILGVSTMKTMISLCRKHHMQVHKTVFFEDRTTSDLLRTLWREWHPLSTEQYALDYTAPLPCPESMSLFDPEVLSLPAQR